MSGNQFKTFALMAAIIALFMLIGGVIGGKGGMLMALIFGGAMNFFAYWYSADMVLRMYNAQEVGPHNAPDLYQMVAELASRAQLPMPKVYVINQDQPNAFATGRNPENAAVAFTTGIMRVLNYSELRGVAAHELSHVNHRDILISTVSATVAGAISAIANMAMWFGVRDEEGHRNWLAGLLIGIFAPLAAAVIQMAISRSREYLADEGAANLTNEPLALAGALQKIEGIVRGTYMPPAEEHPATAQMMIINPLSGEGRDNLFSTHPSTANRIMRLEDMAKRMGQLR
ncbi:zinc metalloprotease HtpX [Aquella oligotrophica]|uniref:Protease HtpX homolog n=1 Tax=Aquella oligotrophica TaxID=2067065 RepID=A0A2I7N7R9_9NEIS|nr:zinc metalloprotease HtpX [Aquella oligotrophica]AUR52480.1 protease HtpX [Aquella oligotrophica]